MAQLKSASVNGVKLATVDPVSEKANGLMTKEDKVKLNGIENNANHYVHPNNSETRHVTDSEKASWNAKETVEGSTSKSNKALQDAKAYTDSKVAGIVNSAPETLDTLKELSDALGNDPNFATTISKQIGTKADMSYVTGELSKKANNGHTHDDRYHTKVESDGKYLGKTAKAESAKVADSVAWTGVSGKPSTFTPSTHTHDDRYYQKNEVESKLGGKANNGHTHDDRYHTKSESDGKYLGIHAKADSAKSADSVAWGNVSGKPSEFVPSHHLHNEYITKFAIRKENVDLNTITEGGFYSCLFKNETCKNFPETSNGYLIVSSWDNQKWCFQMFVNDTHGRVYTRVATNAQATAWTAWSRVYDTNNKPTWNDIQSKPGSFTPSTHTHDDRYYQKAESDGRYLGKTAKAESSKVADSVAWNNVSGKPSSFTPATHTHDDRYYQKSEVEIKLGGKANNGHTHDDRYYTESEINEKLKTKSDTTHNHDSRYFALRGEVNQTTDWNTLTESGCYKVQIAQWGDSSKTHAPCTGYGYGLLVVYKSYVESEGRVYQEFIPHKENEPKHYRMLNSGVWLNWQTIDVRQSADARYLGKTAKAESAKVADSVAWGNVSGKPSTFTPSTHTHDDRYYTEGEVNNLLSGKASTSHNHDTVYLGKTAKAESAKVADSVAWNNVSGKPGSFPPSSHTHNDLYYTKSESNGKYLDIHSKAESAKVADSVAWGNVSGKPSSFTPSTHNHNDLYYTKGESEGRYLGKTAKAESAKVADVSAISKMVGSTYVSQPCYNFENGVLINTGVNAAQSNMFTVNIKGNGYGSQEPINCSYCFYDYNEHDGIINPSGKALACPITLKVFRYQGKVYLWAKQVTTYQTLIFEITLNHTGLDASKIVVSNALVPSSGVTNMREITPAKAYTTINKPSPSDIGASPSNHNHDSSYLGKTAKAESAKVADSVAWGNVSGKPGSFPPSSHTHNDLYYIKSEVESKLGGKANNGHTHDDRYYQKGEVSNLLNGKSNTNHNHDGRYYPLVKTTITDFNTALTEGQYVVAGQLTNGPLSGTRYGLLKVYISAGTKHDNSSNWLWQEYYDTSGQHYWRSKINNSGWNSWNRVYDSVNNKPSPSELGASPSNHNHDSAYLGKTAKAESAKVADSVAWGNVSGKPSSFTPSSHTHDDRYYTESEVNNLLSGKASTSHNHDTVYLGKTAKAESAKVADSVAWGNVSGKPSSFTPSSHTHDDRYYQKGEVDSRLNGKANSNHTHSNLNAQFVAVQIPAGQDLNNYTTPGMYYSPSDNDAQKIKNVAIGCSFSLLVEKHAGIKQTFTCYWRDAPKTFVRNMYNGTWGAWLVQCDGLTGPNGTGWADRSNNWNKVPFIAGDGVMEVGKYIDFHNSDRDNKDYQVRLEAGTDGKLYCYPGFVGDDFYANKYIRLRDWYGAAVDGRIYFKNDGKQMITENVAVFQCDRFRALYGITSNEEIYAYRTNVKADKDVICGGKYLSTITSGGANLYGEGRGGGTHGWHFADLTGQYADIYARVYRQQSDKRTKTEIQTPANLSVTNETVLERINKINTKEYYYNSDEHKKPILGFFAQDLEEQFPLTVSTMHYSQEEIASGNIVFPKDEKGHDIHDLKTIDPIAVTAVMWQGMQEIYGKMLQYEREIENLKNEIKTLKTN